MKKIIKERFVFVFILALVLFTFWDLPKTFYQQDEWQTLGRNLALGPTSLFYTNPISLLFGETRPLSTLMYSIFLGFFKFSVAPAAIFAIFLHTSNCVLVYYLVNKITKEKIIALTAALFLAVNSIAHQGVTWVSAMGTLAAATFILLSIIMYFLYLENPQKKYLILGLVSLIISIYFKGVGLFLFILLPSLFFIYRVKRINIKNIILVVKANLLLVIVGGAMVLFRLAQFLLFKGNIVGYVSTNSDSSFFQTILLRLILYPLTSFFQIFVPSADLFSQAASITAAQYKFLASSPIRDLVAQSIVTDLISVVGSIVILGIVGLVFVKGKGRDVKKNIIFALLFFFLSFMLYVFLDRDNSYLSSRYFYVGAIPAGILFGYVVYFLASLNKYLKWVVFLFVFIYLIHHANIIRTDIAYQVKLGDERQAVLNGIKDIYPNLDKNSVFYVTSDKKYYGEITNPFQNGLGYVLQVWYYDSGLIPKENLTENFLWDLGNEGYKKNGELGFGYYQDIDKLITDMNKNKLNEKDIHAFFINSQSNSVVDITKETREKISTLSAIEK